MKNLIFSPKKCINLSPFRYNLKKPKKSLTYPEASIKYPLCPFGDADKDGKINMFDCRPFDKKRQDTREQQIIKGRHWTIKKKIPKQLETLKMQAQKAKSFKEFEADYNLSGMHGTYWHLTRDKHFKIDPKKGPRDMSSMAGGISWPEKGAIMFTSDLPYWDSSYNEYDEYYSPKYDKPKYKDSKEKNLARAYAAKIKILNIKKVTPVQRGFGQEVFVKDATKNVAVEEVMPIEKARAIDKEMREKFEPQSKEELKQFYKLAKKREYDEED